MKIGMDDTYEECRVCGIKDTTLDLPPKDLVTLVYGNTGAAGMLLGLHPGFWAQTMLAYRDPAAAAGASSLIDGLGYSAAVSIDYGCKGLGADYWLMTNLPRKQSLAKPRHRTQTEDEAIEQGWDIEPEVDLGFDEADCGFREGDGALAGVLDNANTLAQMDQSLVTAFRYKSRKAALGALSAMEALEIPAFATYDREETNDDNHGIDSVRYNVSVAAAYPIPTVV